MATLTIKEIQALSTPRLLMYFKKHYRDRHGRMRYNCFTCGHLSEEDYDDFMVEYNIVKDELNTRGHVE